MVIPLGGGPDDGNGGGMGGMMQPMVGPPPQELVSRFKRIKVCLIAMIVGIVLQLGAGIPLMPSNAFNIVLNSLNGVFIIVVGIFLLKDDPMFAGAHKCLVNTFCSTCADQCQGGMACLCSWFFICLVTAVLALIPMSGSQIDTIIGGFRLIADEQASVDINWGFKAGSNLWYALFLTFLTSEVLVLLAQLLGGWHGFKAMKEWQLATEGQPQPNVGGPPESGGGGFTGGGFTGAGARLGGGGDARGGNAAAPPRATPAATVAFSGQGQRLGS